MQLEEMSIEWDSDAFSSIKIRIQSWERISNNRFFQWHILLVQLQFSVDFFRGTGHTARVHHGTRLFQACTEALWDVGARARYFYFAQSTSVRDLWMLNVVWGVHERVCTRRSLYSFARRSRHGTNIDIDRNTAVWIATQISFRHECQHKRLYIDPFLTALAIFPHHYF